MKTYCVGVDLGGTTVKMGLFDLNGTLVTKWEIPTVKEEKGSRILPDIADSIQQTLYEYEIDLSEVSGVGIGIPGPVMPDGSVVACVNLGWSNIHVKNELEQLTGLEVQVANDANVAALGEMWQGSGKGYKNLVMITLGTGVGGGVVIDEKIVTGRFGAGGELGHMPIVTGLETPCGCGRVGCLEQASSATGVVREANRRLKDESIVTSLRNVGNITAKDVFDAAKEGDAFALEIVDYACKWLGTAMACISSVVDTDVFIIGGGLSKAGNLLCETTTKHYREQVLFMSKETDIRMAILGNDAGIYGAARMAIQ